MFFLLENKKIFQMFCNFVSVCVFCLFVCFFNYDFGKAEVLNFEVSFPRLFLLVLAFCNLFKKSVYPGIICFLLEVQWF